MSNLDQHLEAARSEYESLRYPGNLVSDIAAQRANAPSSLRWTIGLVTTAAALAACVMIVMHFRDRADVQPTIAQSPVVDETTDGVAMFSPGSAPSWSDVYSDGTSGAVAVSAIVPPSWSVVPSEDTLGSVGSDAETTSQESEDTK